MRISVKSRSCDLFPGWILVMRFVGKRPEIRARFWAFLGPSKKKLVLLHSAICVLPALLVFLCDSSRQALIQGTAYWSDATRHRAAWGLLVAVVRTILGLLQISGTSSSRTTCRGSDPPRFVDKLHSLSFWALCSTFPVQTLLQVPSQAAHRSCARNSPPCSAAPTAPTV